MTNHDVLYETTGDPEMLEKIKNIKECVKLLIGFLWYHGDPVGSPKIVTNSDVLYDTTGDPECCKKGCKKWYFPPFFQRG